MGRISKVTLIQAQQAYDDLIYHNTPITVTASRLCVPYQSLRNAVIKKLNFCINKPRSDCKFTAEEIISMTALFRDDRWPIEAIASKYKCTYTMAQKIVTGQSYLWVPRYCRQLDSPVLKEITIHNNEFDRVIVSDEAIKDISQYLGWGKYKIITALHAYNVARNSNKSIESMTEELFDFLLIYQPPRRGRKRMNDNEAHM